MTNSKFAFAFSLITMIGCGGPAYVPQQTFAVPPPTDPCSPSYFNEVACSMAISGGGYWHYGQFMAYPVGFNSSILFYRNGYNSWVSQGNRPVIINFTAPEYTRTYQRQSNVRYSDVPAGLANSSQRSTTPTRDTGTGSYQGSTPTPTSTYSAPITGSQRVTTPTRNQSTSATPQYTTPTTSGTQRVSTPTRQSAPAPTFSQQSAPTNRYTTPTTRYGSSQQSAPSISTSSSSTRSTTASRPSYSSPSPSSSRSSSSSSSSSSGSSRSTPTRR